VTKLYTEAELALNREAGDNKGRLLTALWVHGKGPKGGKVNIGQVRYDAFELLAIENKAAVVFRFNSTGFYWGTLEAGGIVVRFPKLRAAAKKIVPKHKRPDDDADHREVNDNEVKPPWEE